jgi:hypothetical protein
MSRPYKLAVRYFDTDRKRTVIEVQSYFALPGFIEGLLRELMEWFPDILERVAAVDDKRFMASPHKSRRYIASDRDILYIASPHLTEKFSRAIGDHWMITNMGRQETYAFLSTIVSASGLKRESLSEIKL